MEIPNSKAGIVIGKNGDTLRSICQRSSANIFIPKDSVGEWRVVEISGEQSQVEQAQREIDKILKYGAPGGNYYEQEELADTNASNPQLAKISA